MAHGAGEGGARNVLVQLAASTPRCSNVTSPVRVFLGRDPGFCPCRNPRWSIPENLISPLKSANGFLFCGYGVRVQLDSNEPIDFARFLEPCLAWERVMSQLVL
jgi:hypothetical protein